MKPNPEAIVNSNTFDEKDTRTSQILFSLYDHSSEAWEHWCRENEITGWPISDYWIKTGNHPWE